MKSLWPRDIYKFRTVWIGDLETRQKKQKKITVGASYFLIGENVESFYVD
jgi:hypothetical protein